MVSIPDEADLVEAYIAEDRRRALAAGAELPDRVRGAALFADISGFTALTEALVAELGPRGGAEALSAILDRVVGALLAQLHRHGGSVIYFSGDAVTCWLDGDDGRLALACGLAMQDEMRTVGVVALPSGRTVTLAMKVAVAVGPARRFVVGDHLVQLIDVLAGSLMDRLAAAERAARAGEVVLDPSGAAVAAEQVRSTERAGPGVRFLVVSGLTEPVARLAAPAPTTALPTEVVRQWLLPPVYERLRTGRGEFLAELRQAVPLFLRFAGIDYDTDPDAGATLDAFIRAAQRIVDLYGGSTLQLTLGDKGAYLYAVFGAPLAHEDDAARACAAALDLVGLDAEHPVRDLQIGLGLGRLSSGTYGHRSRRTYCCLGDAVNLAARLMAGAPPGQVHASAAVRAAAGPGFRWTRLPDRAVKGKTGVIEAYALEGAERSTVAARHRRHTLPVIGRGPELDTLETVLDEVAAGTGRLVVLRGGAGIGKSRLLAEVGRRLTERGFTVYEGEAPAFGLRTSFGAWHEIWAAALGVDRGEREVTQRRRLRASVAALDSSLRNRTPLLGAVLGLAMPDNELTASLEPKLRHASLLALLRQLLTRLAAGGAPLALVLEDAQWLDPLSVDLLDALARGIDDLPVLILLAERTGTGADVTAALRDLPGRVEIAVGELDEEAIRSVLQAKLGQLGRAAGELPDAVLTLLGERADGNPLFAEELVSFMHGQGVDPTDLAVVHALDLPDSLHSLGLSRIDTLAEGPRRTAKVASVLGRQFPSPMVRGVYPELGTDDDVAGHLASLRHTELLVRDGAPAGPEERHSFTHMVTAQAAYETTPAALRERLHERAGAYLERLGEGSTARLDAVAYHYGRSANTDKKRTYLVAAADAARAAYANVTAIDYYRRAAPLVTAAERPPVLLRLGGVLELTGAWDEAIATYSEALDLATAEQDAPTVHRAQAALGEVARKQGRYDEAAALLRAAETGFAGLDDQAGVGEVQHFLGTLAAHRGAYADATEHYEASLVIRTALDDRVGMGALLSNLAILAEYAGDLDRAKELNEQALGLRVTTGNRWAIGNSRNNLGMIALLRHEPAEAVDHLREAIRLNREVGDEWMVAIARNNLGNALRDLDDLDGAADNLHACLTGYRRFADRWALAIAYEDVAALAVRRGWAEQALRLAGAAETFRAEIGSPRSPAQDEALVGVLAPARVAVGPAADDLVAAGRALDPDAAAALADDACRAPD